MTKIKNTKKGMAKKTLSMSLVVAMLATSNVPVWAAEFSDGTDVAVTSDAEVPVVTETPADDTADAFSAEEEAPVVTDETADAATEVVEKGDLILDNVTVSKSQTFGLNKKVAVTGTIKYKDGNDIKVLDDYYFGWRVKGTNNAIFTDHIAKDNTTDKMSFYPDFVGGATFNTTKDNKWIESQAKNVDWSQYAGKTLELYVYNNEADDNIKIDPTVIGETTIEKCPIEGTLVLDTNKLTYNGKDFYYTDSETDTSKNAVKLASNKTLSSVSTIVALTVDNKSDTVPGKTGSIWNAETVLKYFDVSASKTAKNAGEKLTVTATAKENSPYIGTVTTVEPLKVEPKLINTSTDLVATIDAGVTYPYAGKNVKVDLTKVHLKESDDLSGADLSSAIESATTVGYGIDAHQVALTIKKDALKNFSFTTPNEKTFVLTTSNATDANKVTITQRDLENDCTISIKHDGKVLDKTTVADFVKDYLEIKDKDGTSLKAKTVVSGGNTTEQKGTGLLKDADYVVTVYDEDGKVITGAFTGIGKAYKISVTAQKNTANPAAQTCVRGQELTVSVTDNIVGTVSYTNQANYKPSYTGEAIKPSKSDLGALEITGLDGRTVEFQSDQWEFTGNYTNNVNATTYNEDGTVKARAYAEVKILGNNSYTGQTVQVPFEILPLTVTESSVTVPKTITYNQGYAEAKDYNVQLVVTAKDTTGKIIKGLSADDYTVKYEYVDGTNTPENTVAQNELHDYIKATITVKNPNFAGTQGKVVEIPMKTKEKWSEIVEKAITGDMIKINPSSYVYTGGNITPTYTVLDGAIALYDKADYGDKGEYEQVSITNNKEVGTGTVTVKGVKGKYSGTASANFTITPANTSDVKVTFTDVSECQYTGRQVRPRTFKATLNGNDVTNQFEIVSYGENVSGKGTVVLKPVDGNKNFTGSNITVDFNIIKEYVKADLNVFNSNGVNVTVANSASNVKGYKVTNEKATNYSGDSFDFDGTAKTFASEVLKNISKTDANGSATAVSKAKESDFEIKYVDNISGKNTGMKDDKGNNYNIAYVYVVAKDGTGYTGTKSFTTADGTTIKGVVDYVAFAIKNVKFVKQNVYVQNATYAGGLPVKPSVLVQINGNTLVEGKDYTLTLDANKHNDPSGVNFVNVTDGKVYKVTVTGINGYTGSSVGSTAADALTWGIDKKDIKDCDVKVTNGVVTVMNGYIPVPTTEYTSKNNGDGTYTVTANSTSKNYTGFKTVKADGKAADEKPDAPMISSVKVVGNKATAILSGDSDGAAGYDYVISTDRDCITNKDYDSVNKNQVQTSTTFKYVQQGTYYAYCHAWKRDANGKKVFSDWSNAYPFVVSAITPDAPVITNVKVSGSTIKVTYKAAANATGYDVVLGTDSKKENGETRPYHYGDHKILNLKEGTVTATFKKVPKGTWVVGMHAFNRTSEDGKKVFSPWSNLKKATVK
ncbi:hypothetical protein DWY47_17395 [Ruminococcus sp. AF25-23LB]|nr:hypothetical protein DWY47_17395 [Ruminococcus sp. AF25-23LB]